MFIDLRKHRKMARVHFIPDLKVGVFVTLRAPNVIMMGPGFEGKRIEATEDHVVYKMTGCPVFNAHKEMGADMIITQDVCQAFCSNAVESLNPRYTIRYTKHMCAGDSNCEYIIGLKK